MNELVYQALCHYYHTLELRGYMLYKVMERLLILVFYKDYVYGDYRGLIGREDYGMIERALDCLYGTTCLIPYPDYLKMGKLYLGEISEMAQRVRALEDTPVLKLIHDQEGAEGPMDSDVLVIAEQQA